LSWLWAEPQKANVATIIKTTQKTFLMLIFYKLLCKMLSKYYNITLMFGCQKMDLLFKTASPFGLSDR
jgi:hypothetical protein